MVRRLGRSSPKAKAAAAPNAFVLDPVLDLNGAGRLRDALLLLRGADLRIDASSVQHLGAQCAQVIVAASSTWAADGLAFAIAAPSEPFTRCVSLLGLQSILTSEGANP